MLQSLGWFARRAALWLVTVPGGLAFVTVAGGPAFVTLAGGRPWRKRRRRCPVYVTKPC